MMSYRLASRAARIALLAVLAGCHNSGVTAPDNPAVSFNMAPRDTAIVVGHDYRIRVAAFDSTGNSVQLTPEFRIAGIAIGTGNTITGHEVGRVMIVASSGSLRDTVYLSVVPDATFLAARSDGIYTFKSDGSSLRQIVKASGARSPRWLPGGTSFVYSIGLQHAYKSNLDGEVAPLLTNFGNLVAELWAHPSRDGTWVYFGGYDNAQFRGQPYRVKPDGSAMSLVPGFPGDNFTQGAPSPSPAGDKVAYFREEFSSRNVFVRVLDMTTGNLLVSGVPGHAPEWSHGDSIGYVDMQGNTFGPIRLMSSLGNGRRQVGSGITYDFGFDWSPDDKWIVANDLTSQRLEIIEVRTGLRVTLPYSAGFFNPSWK